MQRRRTRITRSAAARPGNVHSCSHFKQAQPIQGHRSLACVAVPDRSPLRLALRRPAPAGPGRAHVKWGRAGTRPCIARPTSRPRRGDPFESTAHSHRDPVHFYFRRNRDPVQRWWHRPCQSRTRFTPTSETRLHATGRSFARSKRFKSAAGAQQKRGQAVQPSASAATAPRTATGNGHAMMQHPRKAGAATTEHSAPDRDDPPFDPAVPVSFHRGEDPRD